MAARRAARHTWPTRSHACAMQQREQGCPSMHGPSTGNGPNVKNVLGMSRKSGRRWASRRLGTYVCCTRGLQPGRRHATSPATWTCVCFSTGRRASPQNKTTACASLATRHTRDMADDSRLDSFLSDTRRARRPLKTAPKMPQEAPPPIRGAPASKTSRPSQRPRRCPEGRAQGRARGATQARGRRCHLGRRRGARRARTSDGRRTGVTVPGGDAKDAGRGSASTRTSTSTSGTRTTWTAS